jgi:hypothetical protein
MEICTLSGLYPDDACVKRARKMIATWMPEIPEGLPQNEANRRAFSASNDEMQRS